MPELGDTVTVRALWPMPGAADGASATVVWGPHLAALVAAGRFQVVSAAPVTPATPLSDGGAMAPDSNGGDGDDRLARRGRAR